MLKIFNDGTTRHDTLEEVTSIYQGFKEHYPKILLRGCLYKNNDNKRSTIIIENSSNGFDWNMMARYTDLPLFKELDPLIKIFDGYKITYDEYTGV